MTEPIKTKNVTKSDVDTDKRKANQIPPQVASRGYKRGKGGKPNE